MFEKKRVVITGLGVVSPVGNDLNSFWDSLIKGKSGINKIESFDASSFDSKVAAQVKDFSLENYGIGVKEAKRMSRFIQLACGASLEAIKSSNLKIADSAETIGVHIGSGIGGLEVLELQHKTLLEKGPNRCSPFMIPMMISDMAAGQVAILTGAKGPNASTVTACASGTHSIGDAFRIIQMGNAKAMIAGGAEAAITPLGIAGFCAAQALSTKYNDEPQRSSRPFDLDRDGFVMGEGAGIVILEELDHALARGAEIYAEIVGYGSTGDAYHITSPAPEGEGGARAMKLALADANINASKVQYINAHGTSTKLNDKFESLAIKSVFGENTKVAVSSTKSMTGHLLGAAGGVEFVAIVKAIKEDIIPPTINYENQDPDCTLDYVPNIARKTTVNVAMSNSFGFGGHNAILVAKKYQS